MNHPEFVFSRGIRFPSRWAVAAQEARMAEAERALMEIESGHLSGQDASLVAKRALTEMGRVGRVQCEGCAICSPDAL